MAEAKDGKETMEDERKGRELVDWNKPGMVDTLKAMWKDGHSATAIAEALGSPATKSAVIGKANRMKLGKHANRPGLTLAQKREAANLRKRLQRRREKADEATQMSRAKVDGPIRRKKPPKPPVVIEKIKERPASIDGPVMVGDFRFIKSEAWNPLPGSDPIDIMLLNKHTCRWPVSEAPWLFCGRHTVEGGVYCDTHTYISHPRT
jgi:hypothetical protein